MHPLSNLVQKLAGQKQSKAHVSLPEPLVYDVTPFAAEIDLTAMDVIRWAPVWMTRAERLLLYTLAFTLRPTRYLEVGTLEGGSALIVAAAMDALNTDGRLVCVDPNPKITPDNWKRLEHRTTLLRDFSPGILPHARQIAGGPFDFVLIDGDHTYEGVIRDAAGVLPHVTPGAYLVFHDSLFSDVARGIDDFFAQHAEQLADLGTLTREVTLQPQPSGEPIRWGGLRIIQVRRG